jgi:hypothetical protein
VQIHSIEPQKESNNFLQSSDSSSLLSFFFFLSFLSFLSFFLSFFSFFFSFSAFFSDFLSFFLESFSDSSSDSTLAAYFFAGAASVFEVTFYSFLTPSLFATASILVPTSGCPNNSFHASGVVSLTLPYLSSFPSALRVSFFLAKGPSFHFLS